MVDPLSLYEQAGEIAKKIRKRIETLVRSKAKIIAICEGVESMILKNGGKPAFPCNVCVDSVAAHYTSPPDDTTTIRPGSVVKVDFGVHVEGYIVDTATTVALDPTCDEYVKVAEEALLKGIEKVRAGVRISEVSRAIQNCIEGSGFKPIWNLTGHKMGRYVLHTGKSIPNVVGRSDEKLTAGEVYAIEPFVTGIDKKGEVVGSDKAFIFRIYKARSPKSQEGKRLLKWIKSNFRVLPFAERWIPKALRPTLAELRSLKIVGHYPVLVETTSGIVAQAEHSIMVTENGSIVLT